MRDTSRKKAVNVLLLTKCTSGQTGNRIQNIIELKYDFAVSVDEVITG